MTPNILPDFRQYSNEDGFIHDFDILFANARHFNEEDSQVYLDSIVLEKQLRKKKKSLGAVNSGKLHVHKVESWCSCPMMAVVLNLFTWNLFLPNLCPTKGKSLTECESLAHGCDYSRSTYFLSTSILPHCWLRRAESVFHRSAAASSLMAQVMQADSKSPLNLLH